VPLKPIVVLAGGVGAARFLRGLVRVVPPGEVVVIGNTGDDLWWHGLYIAPDLDTVTYWLAGRADEQRGWGIRGDSFTAQRALARLGAAEWFQVGDQDLATHLHRTSRLVEGVPLHEVTAELALRMGVAARILPMSDQQVTTRLRTDRGDCHFQEYFVRDGFQAAVHSIYWTGLEAARPSPGVAEAIGAARAILIAPSNPVISIGPILQVPGMRDLLEAARERTVAVSPLIGGRAIKGPTVPLLRAVGAEPDAAGVARLYGGLASGFVIDRADTAQAPTIRALGYRVVAVDTLLDDPAIAARVAVAALDLVGDRAAA
jgi:LPPG:FO 2-phospho-L-lactate transferase